MAGVECLGIDHIDLTVNDLERSIVFYEKVFAFLGFRRLASAGYVAWGNAQTNIALRAAAPAHRGAAFDRTRVGLHHLALKVRTRAAVDLVHAFLVRERVAVLDPPAEYPQYGESYYAVFFADPDGMKLEVVHFPWGYWRRVQTEGRDDRPRFSPSDAAP